MNARILDTDIHNEVLKQKSPAVIGHAASYLAQHGHFTISSITRLKWIANSASVRTRIACFVMPISMSY